MCGAKEIYCCQNHCAQPIGWYIVEPCEAFVTANAAITQHPCDDGSWSWNWNTSICDCSVPRIVRRQRCRYRSCTTCSWNTLDSTFTAMRQWADTAKEYPEWWTQSQGDDLLFRRTKRRLRHDYDQSRKDNGKKHAVDVQPAFAATSTWPGHPETSGTFSSPAFTLDSFPASSLESFSNGYLSTSNSNLYPLSSTTSGQVWDGDLGEGSSTARMLLGTAGMLDLDGEGSNAANSFAMYPNIEHRPDVSTSYEPPQPSLAFEQAWYGGDQAIQLARSAHEALTHTVNGNHFELNLDDDQFWNNMLASSGDFALKGGVDIGQARSSRPAHSLRERGSMG